MEKTPSVERKSTIERKPTVESPSGVRKPTVERIDSVDSVEGNATKKNSVVKETTQNGRKSTIGSRYLVGVFEESSICDFTSPKLPQLLPPDIRSQGVTPDDWSIIREELDPLLNKKLGLAWECMLLALVTIAIIISIVLDNQIVLPIIIIVGLIGYVFFRFISRSTKCRRRSENH